MAHEEPEMMPDENEIEEEEKRPPIWQLFILPLGLVLLSVLAMFSFRLAGWETKTPEHIMEKASLEADEKVFFKTLDSLAARLTALRMDEPDQSLDPDGVLGRQALTHFNQEATATRPPESKIKRRAAWALVLGVLQYQPAVNDLTQAALGEDPELVMSAIRSLRAIGDPSVATLLVGLLSHKEPGVKAEALYAVGALGGVDYQSEIRRLQSPNQPWSVRCAAAVALSAIVERQISTLLDADATLAARREAAAALSLLKKAPGREELAFLLDRTEVEKMVGEDQSAIFSAETIGLTRKYMITAISAVANLGLDDELLVEKVSHLANKATDGHVKRAAKEALRKGPEVRTQIAEAMAQLALDRAEPKDE